jgi:pyochelin biosynthesis protein PchG
VTGGDGWRPKVVVCGTGFGRMYLAGIRRPGMPFELAGILARGSDRSRACARHYAVPLYTAVEQLPDDVDMACVVVNAGINGGPGAELAQELMARGVHVLQEHPLHQVELAACLRAAHRHRVAYHVNSNYPYLEPVARFVAASRRLLGRQQVVLVSAHTSFPVLYPLLDILGRALGGLRPATLSAVSGGSAVARLVTGTLAGAPVVLQVQNQISPGLRDNGGHLGHRISLVTGAGNLLLADAQGPVLWSPRLHMPADYRDAVTIDGSTATHLDAAAATLLGGGAVRSFREMLREDWPRATAHALCRLRQAVTAGQDTRVEGQYHLTITKITADVTAALGPPELVESGEPRPVDPARLVEDEDGGPTQPQMPMATGGWSQT